MDVWAGFAADGVGGVEDGVFGKATGEVDGGEQSSWFTTADV